MACSIQTSHRQLVYGEYGGTVAAVVAFFHVRSSFDVPQAHPGHIHHHSPVRAGLCPRRRSNQAAHGKPSPSDRPPQRKPTGAVSYVRFNVGLGGDGKWEKIYMYSILRIADEFTEVATSYRSYATRGQRGCQ